MAYVFETQNTATTKITDETNTTFNLKGINGTTNDANIIMGGLSIMLDIVGWQVTDVTRVVNQDIIEEE